MRGAEVKMNDTRREGTKMTIKTRVNEQRRCEVQIDEKQQ